MIDKYKESLDFLFSQLPMFSRTGAAAYKPGLDTSINLSKVFGDPHKKFKSIHIAGTNGKGSTSHLLASILQSQGYKVGLYTSPHLVDFRERMRINGKMIPASKVVEFVENWKTITSQNQYGKLSDIQPIPHHPSFFELTMQMAFNWFAEQKVDYAVIETGMGGRLDSTNIITPILSIITNISWDHNQFLGDTLEKISGEKAGIIKPGIPVVIGETQTESAPVFIKKAKEEDSPIFFADQEEKQISISESSAGWHCDTKGSKFILPLGGDYQKKNIVTVMETVKQLKNLGIEISDKAITEGIEKVCVQTGLAGRWMILEQNPLTIADTGHNTAGLTYNFNQLANLMKQRPGATLKVIIGFVADKAIDKIIKLLPKDAYYYVTNAKIPRALPAEKLKSIFDEAGLKSKSYPNVSEAFHDAKKEASEEDIIFIGGSTFIVADYLANSKGHD